MLYLAVQIIRKADVGIKTFLMGAFLFVRTLKGRDA